MAQAQLVVLLAEGTTLEEGKAIREAILQLRGVDGVTARTPGVSDRLAYQRMKSVVAQAVTDALNAVDTQESSIDEGDIKHDEPVEEINS